MVVTFDLIYTLFIFGPCSHGLRTCTPTYASRSTPQPTAYTAWIYTAAQIYAEWSTSDVSMDPVVLTVWSSSSVSPGARHVRRRSVAKEEASTRRPRAPGC